MALLISEKLNRGIDLLEDASNDQDLLGVALLAFHAALKEQLQGLFTSHPALSATQQQALSQQDAPLVDLLELAQQHGELTREQRWRVEEAEKLVQEFVAGEPFCGSPREVRSYGQFVADLSGQSKLSDYLTSAPAPVQIVEPVEVEQQPDAGLYYGVMRWLPGIALLAILLIVGLWLFGRAANPFASSSNVVAVPTLSRAGLLPTEAAQPSALTPGIPTLEPPAELAPGTRRARIVRLGGGPGWLHEQADFASPTLPIRLNEGQQVIALGPQQQDVDGNPWLLVSVGGYQGWSPLNNVEYETP